MDLRRSTPAALTSRIATALDPSLVRPDLLDALAARLVELDASAPVGWRDAVLHSSPGDPASEQALRAVVGDLLYARGLTADVAGPDLAPYVEAWSAPDPERQEPLLLDHASFAAPETLAAQYDAIVIGSGAGGGIAAQTLAESGRSVLVVERGGLPRRRDLLTDHLRTPRSGSGLFPHSGPGPEAEKREVMLGDGSWRDVLAGEGLWSNNAMTLGLSIVRQVQRGRV
ncbi:FAD-binding protein [Brachybacterium alimentarium]|uniref:FAD-binding protein n=1 Tax=Brachybacterium TaxID=43668 RepID=UPI00131479F2|nr:MULTISPECIES: FAD-binding protein [Brachybacterium]